MVSGDPGIELCPTPGREVQDVERSVVEPSQRWSHPHGLARAGLEVLRWRRDLEDL